MRALPVNLVRRRPWRAWAGTLVLMAAASFAAFQGWRAWQAYMATPNLQRQSQPPLSRADPVANGTAAKESSAIEPAYATDALAVAKLAQFNTASILATIEAARVPGVRVVSVEMAAAELTTRIEIEAPNYQAALQYIAALNKADAAYPWILARTQLLQAIGVTATIIGSDPQSTR